MMAYGDALGTVLPYALLWVDLPVRRENWRTDSSHLCSFVTSCRHLRSKELNDLFPRRSRSRVMERRTEDTLIAAWNLNGSRSLFFSTSSSLLVF